MALTQIGSLSVRAANVLGLGLLEPQIRTHIESLDQLSPRRLRLVCTAPSTPNIRKGAM
jgi:hypothetical protein